jgi:signal transduction histidine kinase
MYYDHPRHPSDVELRLIEEAADLAGLALEHTATVEALRQSEATLRETHEQIQHLAGRLLTAQEDERRRLARELHDDLAQRMAVVAIEAGQLAQQAGIVPEPVRDGLSRIHGRIVDLSEDLYGISRRLHPSILQDLGLVDAIQSECASFSEREAIRIKFTANGEIPALPFDVALCLYRVLQEGLRNVAKHSQARDGRVKLDSSNGLVVLMIEDSGIGFDPCVTKGVAGLGLVSMKERVRLIRGEFSVQSRPGGGTVIEARATVPQG